MKKVKINDVKVKVFQEDDIIEKLGRTKEDWKLVNKYQKKFWQLLQDDEGFCVDARILWEELGKPYSEFGKWIKKKVLGYGYIENTDFVNIEQKVDIENTNISRKQKEYFLTVECAKHVSMAERTEEGRLVRDYFITMEKVVREYEKWIEVREPQKQGNNIMKNAIKTTYEKQNNKKPNNYVYMNENDMLNKCLTGMKAGELRDCVGMSDKNTRDHLTSTVNNALAQLQFLNTSLINSGLEYSQRKDIIQNTVEMNFVDVKLEIEKVIKNKAS